ncbi:MAG: CPBP family intramembrane metalloprotease [Firmicutes bacterium]|nr:CPBP family intramembrane metalloprotease [Bacillota bacterium]
MSEFKKINWGLGEVALVLALRILIVFVLGRFILPLLPAINNQILSIVDRVILILLTLVFALRIGSYHDLGLEKQGLFKNVLYGIAGGVGLFVLATGAQHIFTSFLAADISTNPLVKMANRAHSPWQLLIPVFIAGVMAPIAEELYYRGFAFSAFVKRWGLVIGLIISALFFAAVHLSSIWFWEIALVGAGLAMLYYWTGSIIPGIIAHSIVNTTRLILVYLS